jgi:hypothetical protein
MKVMKLLSHGKHNLRASLTIGAAAHRVAQGRHHSAIELEIAGT